MRSGRIRRNTDGLMATRGATGSRSLRSGGGGRQLAQQRVKKGFCLRSRREGSRSDPSAAVAQCPLQCHCGLAVGPLSEQVMENAGVTVSVGDVMEVKATAEDRCQADSSEAPLIFHLQPVAQGRCEETGETDAATVVLQTHEDDPSVRACVCPGEEVEFGYPITCGDSKAVLLIKKFVCPGINVRCVKYNEQLISPKQFVHLAGKATLKDWKRAIRLGGVMLRKMMNSGQIDFYQHSTVCTNTCRSTKFDLLISNVRGPLQGTDLPVPVVQQGNGGQMEGQVSTEDERPEETVVTAEWSSSVASLMNETETKSETGSISKEMLSFWKGISDVGLMGEVVANIRSELQEWLRGLRLRSMQAAPLQSGGCLCQGAPPRRAGLHDSSVTGCRFPADAAVLSNLALVFGLPDKVKRTLRNQREQTDVSQEDVRSALSGLERQLEEQRKRAPQTDTFECLTKKLQHPGPAAPQFAVLPPVTFSPLGQPFSLSGLRPLGSQLLAHYVVPRGSDTVALHPSPALTLLSTAVVQDASQLGALVSPVELVRLAKSSEAGDAKKIEPEDRGLLKGTVLVQKSADEEPEDESQTPATVIEIDPAPGEHAEGTLLIQGGVEMMEAVREGSSVLVHGDMVEVEEVAGGESLVVDGGMEEVEGGASVLLRGGVEGAGGKASVVFGRGLEEVSGLQVEQLHSVQIVVIKNDVARQQETK
ncbi:glucocorticoid modulatory element-binding protein 1-like [Arapaima gigas]